MLVLPSSRRQIDMADLLPKPFDMQETLPGYRGGIVQITARVSERAKTKEQEPGTLPQRNRLDRVIYFIDPRDPTSIYPESIALKRDCVVTHTPFLATLSAARDWAAFTWFVDDSGARRDYFLSAEFVERLYRQVLKLPSQRAAQVSLRHQTIALIAHDRMKADMLRFVRQNLPLLARFKRRVATGTTGNLLAGKWPRRLSRKKNAAVLKEYRLLRRAIGSAKAKGISWNVEPQKSGPRGGDVQIAELVLRGECQRAVFFEDPHVSREHEADIQLLERTCRVPEVNIPCLHDFSTATEWATALAKCLSLTDYLPITIHHAFRLLFSVELIITTPNQQGRSADQWNAILRVTGPFVVGKIIEQAKANARLGEPLRIAVTWGLGMTQLLEIIPKTRERLFEKPSLKGRIGEQLTNALFVPMVGVSGSSNPRAEANSNASLFAEIFGGLNKPVANYVFVDRHAVDTKTLPKLAEWEAIDIAIFTCDRIKAHLGHPMLAHIPDPIYQQMQGRADAEIAGLFLKSSGDEAEIESHGRVGMTVDQIRRVARRGGSILLVGADSERLDAAIACLRGGLVSTLITDYGFARKLLEVALKPGS